MLRNLKNLPNFQNHKIWKEEEEEDNPRECMRSSLFLLAKSSQKAILKIKIAEMKFFLRFSIARI
jgi:hypothetical protein